MYPFIYLIKYVFIYFNLSHFLSSINVCILQASLLFGHCQFTPGIPIGCNKDLMMHYKCVTYSSSFNDNFVARCLQLQLNSWFHF